LSAYDIQFHSKSPHLWSTTTNPPKKFQSLVNRIEYYETDKHIAKFFRQSISKFLEISTLFFLWLQMFKTICPNYLVILVIFEFLMCIYRSSTWLKSQVQKMRIACFVGFELKVTSRQRDWSSKMFHFLGNSNLWKAII